MRVDNIYVALNRLAAGMPHDEENLRLHPNMHVLDVGSGTGSGAMAISYWLATIKNEMPSRQEIACVEPSRQMRRMASKILKTYYERLHGSLSFAQPVSPFAWKHWIRGGTAQCLHETPSKTFDMILFSHTFHEMDQMQQRAELAHLLHIAQWLTETGILLFLTPTKKNLGNEYAKIQFMHKIARVLTAAGMHHIELESVNAKESAAPERRQLPIIEVRKRLNAECERLGVPFAFNNSDYWRARQPYYGLYCRIDAFTWAKW
jgi:ubiquinone/menaquinone biosynthesis C-methylase UbiE